MKTNPKSWLTKTLASSLLAGAAMLFVTNVQAVTFDYSSAAVGGSIVFPGDGTITFAPATDNFKVTSGSASGFLGEITGSWTIGAITAIPGGSRAPVTGTGTFDISDGTFDLTASLTWKSLQQIGTGGGLNVFGAFNLTGISYGGTNADLLALANAGLGSNVLTFQFVPAVTLDVLKNGPGPNSTSFSGTVTTPDGGTTLALFGLALTGVGFIRRRIKSLSV